MGKGVDAMRDYEMALKLNSRYGLAYFNIGNVYFHHRQFQQVRNFKHLHLLKLHIATYSYVTA